jgi:hypothetical protein
MLPSAALHSFPLFEVPAQHLHVLQQVSASMFNLLVNPPALPAPAVLPLRFAPSTARVRPSNPPPPAVLGAWRRYPARRFAAQGANPAQSPKAKDTINSF